MVTPILPMEQSCYTPNKRFWNTPPKIVQTQTGKAKPPQSSTQQTERTPCAAAQGYFSQHITMSANIVTIKGTLMANSKNLDINHIIYVSS